MKLVRTKSAAPALPECGGGFTNTGSATVIAEPDGAPPPAIYIRRRGPLACAEHALVVVRQGTVVVRADHHRGDFDILVERIVALYPASDEAMTDVIASYSGGEWDRPLPRWLTAAVKAACEKARCYHCREPHYVRAVSA